MGLEEQKGDSGEWGGPVRTESGEGGKGQTMQSYGSVKFCLCPKRNGKRLEVAKQEEWHKDLYLEGSDLWLWKGGRQEARRTSGGPAGCAATPTVQVRDGGALEPGMGSGKELSETLEANLAGLGDEWDTVRKGAVHQGVS